MILNRKSVELLAPAGTWDALVAAVEAGADAVYLGGKRFNMRMHRNKDTNFDDEMLKRAVEYTHAHGVCLYITLNNLISVEEVEPLKDYLRYLNEIKPDAILVQDFAVMELVKEMGIDIPLHTSVMMNTHNEHAIKKLKEYGITRIVVGREMTLSELSLFKERTGLEIEYFMHGDMCISESGQCIHSGVLFGQSGNRGRCMKPCRWPYKLIDEDTKEVLDDEQYRLALNDMCMYRNIPELIQAGVFSFKIEGRMRPADFVRRIVATYRRAIDAYIADPFGYTINEEDWKDLYDNRARNFTTTFALGQPDEKDIGWDGTREPRFFSNAVEEPGFQDDILKAEHPIQMENPAHRRLSVQVSDMDSVKAACANGADAVYLCGESFRPKRPWTLKQISEAISIAHENGAKLFLMTPRTTMRRECGELEQYLTAVNAMEVKPDGILVSNLGAWKLVQDNTAGIPIQADFSFNLFNHASARFMKKNGISMATASLEMSFEQVRNLVEHSELPIEVIVHGSYESMICDHNIAAMVLPYHHLDNPEFCDRHYAMLDRAGEVHSLRMDQFGRNHILFAKDLCYYPYLDKYNGVASFRIEAKDYNAELVGELTKAYRQALDKLSAGENHMDEAAFAKMQESGPRKLGIGVYRFRQSMDALK